MLESGILVNSLPLAAGSPGLDAAALIEAGSAQRPVEIVDEVFDVLDSNR